MSLTAYYQSSYHHLLKDPVFAAWHPVINNTVFSVLERAWGLSVPSHATKKGAETTQQHPAIFLNFSLKNRAELFFVFFFSTDSPFSCVSATGADLLQYRPDIARVVRAPMWEGISERSSACVRACVKAARCVTNGKLPNKLKKKKKKKKILCGPTGVVTATGSALTATPPWGKVTGCSF